jgi:hypothetical protein
MTTNSYALPHPRFSLLISMTTAHILKSPEYRPPAAPRPAEHNLAHTMSLVRIFMTILSNLLIIFPLLVLRAYGLPFHGKRRRCYTTVSDGTRTWRTPSVKSVGNRVEWSGNVDTLWEQSYFYFYFYFQTESPAALYRHIPISQYLFM